MIVESDERIAKNAITSTPFEPQVGSWVKCVFSAKYSVKHFIGQVIETSGNEYVVLFLKNKSKKVYFWPTIEDRSIVSKDMILELLPEPDLDRRGYLMFCINK